MKREILGTHQKALQTNIDATKYGTFAEIGAGQEVARWYFRVGGASGTIAKTISAYDMTISDAIYGASDRYVSRRRLQTMLDYEYKLLTERLDLKRGEKTTFFVFADTVTARPVPPGIGPRVLTVAIRQSAIHDEPRRRSLRRGSSRPSARRAWRATIRSRDR